VLRQWMSTWDKSQRKWEAEKKKKEGTGCEGNRSIKEDEVMRRGMRRR
jgi:hypothetical protein